MTDFKIRAIRNAKAPYTNINVVEGDILPFVSNSFSTYGEPWVRVKHPMARGGEVYFEAKDFEPVPTESRNSNFNNGDRVTCNSSTSYYATEMVGGEYTVAYATETWNGTPLVALNEGEYMVEPATLSHVPKATGFKRGDQVVTSARTSGMGTHLSADAVYTVEDLTALYAGLRRNGHGQYVVVPPGSLTHYTPKAVSVDTVKKPASPPGWTFRAAPSDFDGPRILRELEAQGAQYAVIVWGKGEDERIAVISQDLDERSDAHAKAKPGPSVLFSSTQALQDFGPGKAVIHSSSEWGWHEVTLPDESPARLKDLKALAGRVEAWERVNAKVRVYVAYGQAGDK